jgi:hypothetical protein
MHEIAKKLHQASEHLVLLSALLLAIQPAFEGRLCWMPGM